MKKIYEQIAKQYGVTVEEVEREIASALEFARALDLPQARDFWQNTPNDAKKTVVALAKQSILQTTQNN